MPSADLVQREPLDKDPRSVEESVAVGTGDSPTVDPAVCIGAQMPIAVGLDN